MSDDRQDISEALDGDVLGEEIGDSERPGAVGYPPDRSLGAEDPSLVAEDDLATRATARRSLDTETDFDEDDAADATDLVLVDVTPEGELDQERELLADAVGTGDPEDERPAEEAAIHLIDQDPVD